QIENSSDDKLQFRLKNKNGVSLTDNRNIQTFNTEWILNSEMRFTAKSNNEIHNWLREWYPGKENEKQKYDGIQIIADEKDPTKKIAKDSSGNVIKNSWVNVSDNHYYAGSDGFLLKDWQNIEGKTYYFGRDGAFKRGYVNPDIDGKQYHFDDGGALQKSTWHNKQYSDHTGALIKEGLREIDGEIYYFQNYEATTNELRLENQDIILHFSDKGALEKASRPEGGELKDFNGKDGAYVTLDKKELFFEKDGSIRKSGASKGYAILAGENKPVLNYYSLEEGLSYSGWKEIDGKKYHFQWGRHTTFDGHEEIDGKRYYFNQDGEAKLTGFDKVDGKIYHYNDKGEMQTGWQKIDGKDYYFDDSGAAKIGWFSVGGGYHFPDYGYFTYYAKQDGSIYTDTKVEIDGKTYTFDSHGHKGY
ncbi:cell wall-binding protein, partial [Bacillus mycoides]|nr:cell wall-binding protein [Bacillus mycoides]